MNVLASGRVVEIGTQQLALQDSTTPEEAAGAKKLLKWHKGYVRQGLGGSLAEIEKFLKTNRNFSAADKIGEGDVSPL